MTLQALCSQLLMSKLRLGFFEEEVSSNEEVSPGSVVTPIIPCCKYLIPIPINITWRNRVLPGHRPRTTKSASVVQHLKLNSEAV